MNKVKHNSLITSGIYAILFILLAISIKANAAWIINIDSGIQHLLTPSVTQFKTHWLTIIAYFADPTTDVILTVIVALVVWFTHHHFAAFWVLWIQLGGDAIAFLCKNIIQRVRPANQLSLETGFSFPSGHIFCTTLLMCILFWLIAPKLKTQTGKIILIILATIWIILIAYSRVYLRDHYLTDVIGSLLLAGFWWELMQYVYLKISISIKQK